MTYEEAYAEALQNAQKFRQFKRNGRTMVEVRGQVYPLDWIVRHAARMKIGGEV